MKIKLLSLMILSFVISNPADAVLTAPKTIGLSKVSLKPAVAIVGSGAAVATAGIINKSWWGTLVGGAIAAGGITVALIDPPGGTFFSGTFAVHYPSDLMTPGISGWLGTWGEDPTLLPPPVSVDDWGTPGNETLFTLQNPNAGLSASVVNTVAGVQSVAFDWGSGGHSESSSDPLNIFAAKFIVNSDVQVAYLGDFISPPEGANFFVSTPIGIECLPAGETIMQQCGELTTSYYSVTVPEPSSLMLLLVGVGAMMAGLMRKKIKQQ